MNKGSDIFKKILLGMTFVIMFIHVIYNDFNFIKIPPLKGYVYVPEKPLLNDSTWFSGEYQLHQEDYVNSNFGFRSLYVRLNNQMDFCFFKKVNANGVVLGKENYLYEEKYIQTYRGQDFMGLDSIDLLVTQIKFVSECLAKRGKQLMIIFAPSKASFYPEYIPDSYPKINDSTNYKFLSSAIKQTSLNVIDFNKWFVDNKYKSKYPLYPKYANHWSNYGAVLAADSIINYIQHLRNIDMPNLIYDKIDMKQPFGIDYDIADGMNLITRLKSVDMAYPRISTEDARNKIKPNVLVVSDSFYWGMYYFGIANSFSNEHFWYYNEQVYPESNKYSLLVDELDIEKEINAHDVFIVMATEHTLSTIGWGFLENMENYFSSKPKKIKVLTPAEQLLEKKNAIMGDKKWMEQITQKASDRNISVDSMVTIDAVWLLEQSKAN